MLTDKAIIAFRWAPDTSFTSVLQPCWQDVFHIHLFSSFVFDSCGEQQNYIIATCKTLRYKNGDYRNRTGDLVHAKHTRYQLRQIPMSSTARTINIIIIWQSSLRLRFEIVREVFAFSLKFGKIADSWIVFFAWKAADEKSERKYAIGDGLPRNVGYLHHMLLQEVYFFSMTTSVS